MRDPVLAASPAGALAPAMPARWMEMALEQIEQRGRRG